jgi:hypothetical protein
MTHDWSIQSRSEACAVTGRPFAEGEPFYALLFSEKGGFRREDVSEEAFPARREEAHPFSFWKSRFEPKPPPPPEALGKETAEDLLRRYMAEENPGLGNARYLLALMLERKRLFRQVAAETRDGTRILVYEHVKTGETFVVPDPELRLDQLEAVQNEVASLLA